MRYQADFKKQFIITTDASVVAVGGILSQKDDKGIERMIHTFSKTLSGVTV